MEYAVFLKNANQLYEQWELQAFQYVDSMSEFGSMPFVSEANKPPYKSFDAILFPYLSEGIKLFDVKDSLVHEAGSQ